MTAAIFIIAGCMLIGYGLSKLPTTNSVKDTWIKESNRIIDRRDEIINRLQEIYKIHAYMKNDDLRNENYRLQNEFREWGKQLDSLLTQDHVIKDSLNKPIK